MTLRDATDGGTAGALGRLLPWLLAPCAAAGWWLVGFLPWLADGLRRQGLTGGPFAPDQGLAPVRMAVPLVAEELAPMVVMGLLGGVVAGALAGLCRDRPAIAVPCILVGVGVGATAAVLQARSAVEGNATGSFASDDRVLGALVAVLAVTTVTGLVLGLAATLGPAPVRPTALAGPAVVLPGWVEDLLPGDTSSATQWLLALTLGLALAASVPRSARQALAWLPAVLVAWTAQAAVPALVVTASAIRPGSGLDHDPWYPLDVARDVLRSAFTTSEAHLLPAWAAAACVAGTAVVVARSRAASGAGRDLA